MAEHKEVLVPFLFCDESMVSSPVEECENKEALLFCDEPLISSSSIEDYLKLDSNYHTPPTDVFERFDEATLDFLAKTRADAYCIKFDDNQSKSHHHEEVVDFSQEEEAGKTPTDAYCIKFEDDQSQSYHHEEVVAFSGEEEEEVKFRTPNGYYTESGKFGRIRKINGVRKTIRTELFKYVCFIFKFICKFINLF
jgi:hypothetical protein